MRQITSFKAFWKVEGRKLRLREPRRGGWRSWGTNYAEATVDKSVGKLRTEKLDLEFSIDPLFKTCVDFDGRGTHGC